MTSFIEVLNSIADPIHKTLAGNASPCAGGSGAIEVSGASDGFAAVRVAEPV